MNTEQGIPLRNIYIQQLFYDFHFKHGVCRVSRKNVVETESLTRRFGEITAVDSLDLRVPQGAVYGFLGPNGAGKTTTIRMLLGLIKPDEGHVSIFEKDIRKSRMQTLGKVGALVETPSLYPHLTGRENLAISQILLGIHRARIEEVIKIVGLANNADRPVRQYSLGMKQRLGLAIALLNTPDLLILDEPTNGLDPAGILEIRDLIKRLPSEKGITVFLSSHLLSEVERVATHVGIINKGKKLFQGSLQELNEHSKVRLELEVDKPDAAQKLLADKGWRVEPNDGMLRVDTDKKEDAAAISSMLVREGIRLFLLNTRRSSLEDIFLNLTDRGDVE